jgi:hypothetical protein
MEQNFGLRSKHVPVLTSKAARKRLANQSSKHVSTAMTRRNDFRQRSGILEYAMHTTTHPSYVILPRF